MSLESKVLVSRPKKSMFALILIHISFQIFASGQHNGGFGKNSIRDFNFVDSNLQNSEVEAKFAAAEKLFRLPSNVKPVLYDLKMVPNLFGNFNFFGEVNIQLKIETATSRVILHSYKLNINSVKLFKNKRRYQTNYTVSLVDQTLIIETRQKIFPGNRRLNIKFDGSLNDELLGFYRSSYKVGNTTKWLAVTEFEATYARWAFPCFDEPGFRAPFRISIARYPYQKAISNMPLNTTSGLDPSIWNRVWDTFQVTPPLPTYLVAFSVSEFNNRIDAAGKVRVWARENAINDTAFALTQAVTALKNIEAFVGVPYSLPKLDILAVPDFLNGAMENWGLTIYRERLSLFNAKIDDERNKEQVTSIIVHEFAHQWFGDSVTLAWWDYLWLNEGFATYIEYFVTDIMEPNWRMNELFIVEKVHNALNIDGISTHSAMSSQVSSLSDIESKFNGISYDKGTWKNGVAEPSNLYAAFEEQLKIEGKSFPKSVSVTTVFQKFADQYGYPCILVSRQPAIDRYNIHIKQVPYKSPRSSQKIFQKTWVVPLTCTKQSQPEFNNTQPSIWLIDENEIVLPNGVRKDEWYICNLQQSGYFRVNYDKENWELLIKQLHSSHLKIHQLNRAQLINDACTFAKDDFLPHTIMFNLLRYLARETDPIPWYRGLMEIYSLIREHVDSKAFEELLRFAKHIVGDFYSHVGFYEKPEDTHLVKTVRSQLLFVACDLEIEEPVAKAQLEFSSRTDLSQIPAYAKETVLCNAIKTNSDISVWNKLWDLFSNSSYDFEKATVISAIGCATNQTLLKKYLHKLVDKDDHDIRKQDEKYVLRSITRFSRGVTASINYIHDILPKIENCTKTHDVVMKLLYNIMNKVQSREQIHRLEHVIEEAEKLNQQKFGGLKKTLLKIKVNAIKTKARIDEEAEKIHAALASPVPSIPEPSSASVLIPHIVIFMTTILNSLLLNK